MLRRHIILLIAIRPSDGDVKPGSPLGAFREEQAMSQHRVSPSPFLSSSSHTTQLHYTNSYTYSHPNLNFLPYTIQILIPHVMWSAQAVHNSKIDHLAIYPPCMAPEAHNSSVGWHWNTHTHTHTHTQVTSCRYDITQYHIITKMIVQYKLRKRKTLSNIEHHLQTLLYCNVIRK